MPHRGHCALHDEHVRTRFLRDAAVLRGFLGDGGHGGNHASFLHLLDAGGDQALLHGFLVEPLQEAGDLRLVGFEHLLENFLRMLVAGLDTFKIEYSETAEFAHLDGKGHVHDPIHRAGEDGDLQLDRLGVAARDQEGGVDLVGVDRHRAGYEGDFVKSVSDPRFAVAADPHAHRKEGKGRNVRG